MKQITLWEKNAITWRATRAHRASAAASCAVICTAMCLPINECFKGATTTTTCSLAYISSDWSSK